MKSVATSRFVAMLASAITLFASLATPARAETFEFAVWFSDRDFYADYVRLWASEIDKRTEGRVKMKLHFSGALVAAMALETGATPVGSSRLPSTGVAVDESATTDPVDFAEFPPTTYPTAKKTPHSSAATKKMASNCLLPNTSSLSVPFSLIRYVLGVSAPLLFRSVALFISLLNAVRRSTGKGNTIVVFFSAPISTSVCR